MHDAIPAALLDKVREGEVVLYLGAGASIGALSDDASKVPTAAALANAISTKFLGGEDGQKPLPVVAELAISDHDLLTIQQFIRDVFVHFHPAPFQKLIPTFRWSAIATTNYDLIIEEAYGAAKPALQRPVPFYRNSDRVDQKLRTEDSVPLLKLHGCISRWSELDVPLILTTDQYVTHKKGRDRLFARFKDYASEYTVVFVGHSLEDPDLRQILMEVSTEDVSRPRYWTVAPHASDREKRFWETKRISTLPLTFEQFLVALDQSLDRALRSVTISRPSHPIERRIVKRAVPPSADLLTFVQNDVTYLRADLADTAVTPRDFYKGYAGGWGAIQQNLDSKRHLTDTVLSDVILLDDVDRPAKTDVYVMKGYAGSGKSLILKRIAWDAAATFGKLCLFANPGSRLPIQLLAELSELTGERIFLFVDSPSQVLNDLVHLLRIARGRTLPLTVVCAERTNEWNGECTALATYVSDLFEVRYLSHPEIEWLLEKLTAHKSLGSLDGKPKEAQIKAFTETADRQLIVALHEATSGLPFREIVFNEYSKIQPDQAQHIYLTVCTLNRLDIPVRAGLIKRMHGVSFDDFKDRFFLPLEGVVYVEPYTPIKDMAYRARHPWIAEVVFEQALPTEQQRFNLYMQIMDVLDIGYESDRKAYRGLIRARELLLLFPDPLLVRRIFESANALGADDAYFHQQRAIYEMRRPNANLSLAYEELQRARTLAPNDKSIVHTLADLEIKRADSARSELERERYLRAAQELAATITGQNADSSHGYHTVCMVTLSRLEDQLRKNPDDQVSISQLVRQAEQQLSDGIQRFPEDSYLADAEVRLAKTIGQDKRAIAALERVIKANQGNAFLAKALSRLYEERGELARAREVLQKCLEVLPADKTTNAALAQLLTTHFPSEGALSEQYWRRSFTEGDANHQNQFWYARQLYINGQQGLAKVMFGKLSTARVSPEAKLHVRGILRDQDGTTRRFIGRVQRLEATYAWVSRDADSMWIFLHRSNSDQSFWEQLQANSRVGYEIGFNYKGPAAADPSLLED